MDYLALILFAFVLMEALQVFLLSQAVKQIKSKVYELVPDGITPGQVVADAVICFMKDVQTDPEKGQIVAGFLQKSAIVAFEGVKQKIPMLGGVTGGTDEAMEKLAKKNPYIGLALGLAQAFGPMVVQKAQEAKTNAPSSSKGRSSNF